MGRFAFLLHPPSVGYFFLKFPWLRPLPARWIEGGFRHVRPWVGAHITGIASPTGAAAEGHFVILPWTPRLLLETPWPQTLERLVAAGRLAERAGAQIFGLGAYTKIAGDRGVTLNRRLGVPVTTGNSYTAATAVEGALLAARRMGGDPSGAAVAIVGATGAIGAACARILAPQVGALRLVARDRGPLEALREEIGAAADVSVEVDLSQAIRDADVVLCVSSALEGIVDPRDLRPGAVVCDVSRPRNVSEALANARDDVLVIDGGVIAVPGEQADFGMNFGLPPRMAEACIAETIILALEQRWEPFTLGREIRAEQVREIAALATKHGFRLAAFRRFDRAIPDAEVDAIAERAAAQRRQRRGA